MLTCVFVLISVVTTTLGSGTYFCSISEFKCKRGSNCIRQFNVCDGTRDCEDGSDEESCFGSQSSNCVLPPLPAHGSYEVLSWSKDSIQFPEQPYNSFLLKVKCDPGYGIVESGLVVADINNTLDIFCVNGKWSQKMAQCVRFCRLDPDPSVRYLCSGRLCKNYVPTGTVVVPVCNSPIYYSNEGLFHMTCHGGSWNYIARCRADCGRVTPSGTQLVIDGIPAKRGEFPWHVGVYRKTSKPFTQICGGSLISNDVVISAAHCFWSDLKQLLPASDYAVAAGKLYRAWKDSRDIDAQKSDVSKKILIPTLFNGALANFQEDIALLILTTSIVYKTFVRPVCLNFEDIFDRIQLEHGNLGKVAGWGLTSAKGGPAQYLQILQMPFISEGVCVRTLPPSFTPYITGDKFCAGYTNGTAVCKGDSGGGLAFPDRELGMERYYLRGVVSTAPNLEGKKCNDMSYTTFTKITRHEDIIQKALAEAVSLKSCQGDQEAACNPNPPYVEEDDSNEDVTSMPVLLPSADVLRDAYKCVLPPSPDTGVYEVKLDPQDRSLIIVNVQCVPGYGVKGYPRDKYKKLSCIINSKQGIRSRSSMKCVFTE